MAVVKARHDSINIMTVHTHRVVEINENVSLGIIRLGHIWAVRAVSADGLSIRQEVAKGRDIKDNTVEGGFAVHSTLTGLVLVIVRRPNCRGKI